MGITVLGELGVIGYRVFSEEQKYERSLAKRTPEERFLIRAQNGETDEVKSLLAAGISPDTKDEATGVTGLTLAGIGGHSDTVKVLLDAGADVNGQDPNGLTALIGAARLGRTDTVKVLIAAGANVNARRSSGGTALRTAKEAGHTEVVQLLQQAGAQE